MSSTPNQDQNPDPAINIIRSKIAALYQDEPNAKEEISEDKQVHGHRSKHQEYMHKLSTSGKSLAEIQTAWHNYYVNLPDSEKHQVWQEFYEAHGHGDQAKTPTHHKKEEPPKRPPSHKAHTSQGSKTIKPGTVADIKKKIAKSVSTQGKLSKKQHLHSILFGFGAGAFVLLVFLFGFFNERFIAPFITPSKNVSSTPIIIDPDSAKAGPNPEIIIPKINVEIPVVYDASSINEEAIQAGLKDGVVHYPTTPDPGQKGNAVIVGHSSNNIFNSGKYKFAFVLLNKLEKGDTFYLTKNGTRYAYRIYEKKIVSPDDVSVLRANNKIATATLITCDPPGTSINRLLVIGEQISPSPAKNKKTQNKQIAENTPEVIPGNAESLWHRFTSWLFG